MHIANMVSLDAHTNNPFRRQPPPPQQQPERDEWEDWSEDERPATTILDDGPMVDIGDGHTGGSHGRRDSMHRYSVQKPMFRAKSKGHAKAKIAKAGITLDTNVAKSRNTPRLQRKSTEQGSARPENAVRFADAAALRALEGSPNSASVGSFSWLRRKPGNLSAKSPKSSPLSPESRPIVIGIAMPSDTASEVSPQTAVIETPMAVQRYNQRLASQTTASTTPVQMRSVWSPDTEASESPYSSVYSQMSIRGGGGPDFSDAPPVPSLPATYKYKQAQQQALIDLDDDENGTPCTLFEEDGSPMASRKSNKPASAISPDATGTPDGWWNTVRISQQTNHTNNPFRQTPMQTGESSSSALSPSPNEWWHKSNENEKRPLPQSNLTANAAISQQNTGQSSPSVASSSQQPSTAQPESQSEKARILLEQNQNHDNSPVEQPPPYSLREVKYGGTLAPAHAVSTERIPSPGPMSPGIAGTMASQGAIMMDDVPITPRVVPSAVLHDRPVGTQVTNDQFTEAPGTNMASERNRRRHEKEEFYARKVGGFWRGRGCIPAEGCFGRTGREGRKRRRIYLGICGGLLAAIILAVFLAVIFTHKLGASTAHDSVSQDPVESTPSDASPISSATPTPTHNVWLNLTDFPPMPTGVLTVAGANNTKSDTRCLTESAKTLWSCSIPKNQQDPDSKFKNNQPEFIFQIQFDNNTRALWNLSDTSDDKKKRDEIDDEEPSGIFGRRSLASAVARAAAFVRRAALYDTGFSPSPAAPDHDDLFFLGNTTDDIQADDKAGEATPFYISMLSSVDGTVGPDVLSRRGLGNGIDTAPSGNGSSASQNISHFVDAPVKNDLTPLPAVLFPLPSQQPVRLYDRGLATEHYGFYTYFNKSIFIFDQTEDSTKDADGGALLKDATALVVWSQARFLVKIWTRLDADLLGGRGPVVVTQEDDDVASHDLPGTMPYPVTVGEDFHGGDETTKGTIVWPIGAGARVDTSDASLVTVDKGAGGTLINPLASADRSLGGVDGGSGGCKCSWINFETDATDFEDS